MLPVPVLEWEGPVLCFWWKAGPGVALLVDVGPGVALLVKTGVRCAMMRGSGVPAYTYCCWGLGDWESAE